MTEIEASKVVYEIKNNLGSGLTSQVYRAIRKDREGLTGQEVALKIINSKKDVQTLKLEFENLLKIQSKYCVRVMAWESLKQGPAMVMEYIEGLSLHQLCQKTLLSLEIILEIVHQIKLGLSALHRKDVYHGDLNLKNIMVSGEGTVKLIDFGFQGESGEQYLTPRFSSDDRQAGLPPDEDSDQYSLQAITSYLIEKNLAGPIIDINTLKGSTKASRRRILAELVRMSFDEEAQATQCVTGNPTKVRRKYQAVAALVFIMSFLVVLLRPFNQNQPEFSKISIRSKSWFSVKINGVVVEPGNFLEKSLRSGLYNIELSNSEGVRKFSARHPEQTKFLLQLPR